MKLLIVTVVDQLHDDLLRLFKQAQIRNFSGSDIEGYRNKGSLLRATSWFPGSKEETDSHLFFSFTEEDKIDVFFELVQAFNEQLETHNPVKAVVVPIERSI